MITKEEIKQFKDTYERVFQMEVVDEIFIGREITKAEFDRAVNDYPNEEEREEYVCELCILYPQNYGYGECYAGIPTTLTYNILKESGLIENGALAMLEEARSEMRLFDNQIAPIICAAFPGITLDEVNGWTLRKQIKYLSRAEWMLQNVHGLNVSIGTEASAEDNFADFPELRNEPKMLKNAGGR